MQKHALPVNVDGSPPFTLVLVVSIGSSWKIQVLVITVRLVRFDARPPTCRTSKAADGEGVVALPFRAQPEARLSREEAIIVALASSQAERSKTDSSPAGDEQSKNVFHIPAAIDELVRRASRSSGGKRLALAAEIVENAGQPWPNRRYQKRFTMTRAVSKPRAVLGIDEPVREVEAAGAICNIQMAKKLRHRRLYDGPLSSCQFPAARAA